MYLLCASNTQLLWYNPEAKHHTAIHSLLSLGWGTELGKKNSWDKDSLIQQKINNNSNDNSNKEYAKQVMQNTVAVYQLINAQLEQPFPGQHP